MDEKYVVDTNFIYSLYVQADSNHKKVKHWLSGLKSSHFIVPYIVVAELIASGENIDFRSKLKQFSRLFTKNTDNDLDYIDSLDKRLRRQLKANDCLILAICMRFNAQLLSFDQKLIKALQSLQ